jgi:arylformamidase
MRIYDVTRSIGPGCVVYPGDVVPAIDPRDTGQYRISNLHMSTHSGTHIDAPYHYCPDAARIDEIDLSALVGRCRVIDLGEIKGLVKRDNLQDLIGGSERVLLKSWFSRADVFDPSYPSLSRDAAAFLIEEGVRCIGTDTPSIEAFECDGSVHRLLCQHSLLVIELLDLGHVPAGEYHICALPLKVKQGDGAPARVILMDVPGDNIP